VGISQRVAWAQCLLAKSPHRVRATQKEVPVGWQRGRVTQCRAITGVQPEIERHLRKMREREKLLIAVVRYQVLNIGARNRAGQEKRVRHAASGKYRAIASVEPPAAGQLDRIRPRAENIATADVSEVGGAVVTYPILQLGRAAGGRGEIGVLERGAQ